MSEYCVVVADGTRARFFTLEAAQFPEMESGPNLIEKKDLINPETETAGRELWTDTKSGRNATSSSGMAHGYDDHRDRHMDEFLRRFAGQVSTEALRLAQEQRARHLILISSKRMLGFLRGSLVVPPKTDITVNELAKDLTHLSIQDLQTHLDNAGLIRGRRRPPA
jgi:protein required for attachment to host cells